MIPEVGSKTEWSYEYEKLKVSDDGGVLSIITPIRAEWIPVKFRAEGISKKK